MARAILTSPAAAPHRTGPAAPTSSNDGVRFYAGQRAGSSGDVTVDGTGSQLIVQGGYQRAEIGRDGTGTLTITNGGYALFDSGTAGAQIAPGTYSFNPDYGFFTGGYSNLTAARGASGNATVLIDGVGSQLVATGLSNRLTFGRDGQADVTVSNGGQIQAMGLDVGRGGASNGNTSTLTVDNGSVLLGALGDTYGYTAYDGSSGAARFGRGENEGRGYLNVINGGQFVVTNVDGVTDGMSFQLGRSDGSYGRATIDGAGAQLRVEQVGASGDDYAGGARVEVGRGGRGTLEVINGAQFNVLGDLATVFIGRDINNPFTVDNVVDAQSLLRIDSGSTAVVDAGSYAGGNIIIAEDVTHDGRISVEGAGSSLTIGGTGANFVVAERGTGTLEVLNGATVTNQATGSTSFVGRSVGSTGNILVDGGPGNVVTSLDVGDRLLIGAATAGSGLNYFAGTGTVTVARNGDLFADEVFIGANGTLAGGGAVYGDIFVNGGGTITPGGASVPSGALDVDNVTILDGRLAIDIGSSAASDIDLLDADNTIDFQNGGIDFNFTNGFMPSAGDRFVFASAGTDLTFNASSVAISAAITSSFIVADTGTDLELEAVAGSSVALSDNAGDPGVSIIIDDASATATGGRFDSAALFGFDTFSGTAAADTFDASAATSGVTFNGGAGADAFIGGAGVDTVTFADSSAGIFVQLGGSGLNGNAQGDTFRDIENVIGSQGNDQLRGDGGANVLDGQGGNDLLLGNGGDDTLIGGTGNDTFIGGAGADSFDGGADTDRVSYFSETANLFVVLNGGAATGGNAQGDTLTGIENVTAGQGNDQIRGDGEANFIDGQDGNDLLIGNGGNDTLVGGLGNDTFIGGAGADLFQGGDGVDRVSYFSETANLLITIGGSAAGGNAQGDALRTVENITAGQGNDQVRGDGEANLIDGQGGNDLLIGNGGNDTLVGGEGNDTFIGGAGADLFQGGAGTDRVSYFSETANLLVTLGGSAVGGTAQGDALRSVENVTGGQGNDQLRGDGEANFLDGQGGNDILVGNGGNDTLRGGEGNDVFIGGTGADLMFGDGGSDRVSFFSETSDIFVQLGGSGIGGEAQGDAFRSIENVTAGQGNDEIRGDGEANVIDGQGGNDFLRGGGGNDTLIGGAGNDTFIGDAGADRFFGDAGVDRVTYSASTTGVTIDLVAGGQGGEAQGDTFNSIESVTGSQGGDVINGDANNNVINGFLGDDTINGGGGNDTLFGSSGTDTFVFSDNFGNDRIADFADGTEVLDVTAVTGASAATLNVGTSASGNALVDFGGADTIELLGITNIADITADDFNFV